MTADRNRSWCRQKKGEAPGCHRDEAGLYRGFLAGCGVTATALLSNHYDWRRDQVPKAHNGAPEGSNSPGRLCRELGCKYLQISAAFYDNDQVSMHPMVVYYLSEEGNLETHSYVGISAEGSHTFATSLTFILRMLLMLQEMLPQLEVVHFISDGPSSQYRNRTVVETITRFQEISQLKCSWTWLEAGHGKGPCNGVGGGLKSE